MSRQLEVLYPEKTFYHGSGTVGANSTSEQFMVVSGDDTYIPASDKDAKVVGVLLDDRASGKRCTIISKGYVRFTEIGGSSPSAGDEIQVDASTGFPTKLSTGTARGLITDTSDGFVVELY
jgi:hypothetical protein